MGKSARVFCDFLEYWYYAKHLSDEQRKIVFNSLPPEEQASIEMSYKRGGWDDVLRRNTIDSMLLRFEKKYNINLIEVRSKVFHGKSVYISRHAWEDMSIELTKHGEHHINFCIGGVVAEVCQENEDVVLLLLKQDYGEKKN